MATDGKKTDHPDGTRQAPEYEVLATRRGTLRYKERLADRTDPSHFRLRERLYFSSIGCGTYLGDPDDATDAQYENALWRAIELGCNVIDTAINYRHMRSERVIGRVLKRLTANNPAAREEIIVATKGGFIPFDGEPPADPVRYIKRRFIERHVIIPEDIVGGGHCMTPEFLEDQLEQSLQNLQLECVDIYYVHNPETQLDHVPRKKFYTQLHQVFQMLERKATEGKIHFYGLATWNGFVVYPDDKQHLPLGGIVELARMAGGDNHHMRFIQLPFNFRLLDAFSSQTQLIERREMSILDAAKCCDVAVVVSAPLLQGRLSARLPAEVQKFVPGLKSDAQRSIQFARSAPGVLSALVGMKSPAHVEENLALAAHPCLRDEEFLKMFE
ncbi:MAG: aldo/keto reductase [Candidatus Sumerlaeia bacterium]